MFDTMYAKNGCGLAAPQIGISKQLAVIDAIGDKTQQLCLINPVILEEKDPEPMQEACLSVPGPGVCGLVTRATWVKMKALDRNGEIYELVATDLLAEIIQHEIDHLHGLLYIDKLSSLKRQRLITKMKKHVKYSKQK